MKKVAETGAIFDQLHKANGEADETEGVLRVSMAAYEKAINRVPGLEDYFVDINPAPV